MKNNEDAHVGAGILKNPKVIAILALVVLFVILILQNKQVVTLKIYFWEIAMSQIILIPLVLLTGFVAGYLVARFTGKPGKSKGPKPTT
jgi:uncharacterized integral membrane protein